MPDHHKHRYWTYLNIPKPDMGTSREQGTWLRFQQIECAGADMAPPCKLVDWPMYWDSMWFARFPGANVSDTIHQTLITGGTSPSQPVDFYAALLELRRWWDAELDSEGMMSLSLPSPVSTNGTLLQTQAVHSIVRSMITRQRSFHPRYGVSPGYGGSAVGTLDALHGLPDVMTSTTTAALEMGAMSYAKGVLANYFNHYVRDDGMLHLYGVELPSTCRVLTVLALYYGYSDNGSDLMLEVFPRAKALAEWLAMRRSMSFGFAKTDPRYGIPQGSATVDQDNDVNVMDHAQQPLHYYASASEMYRAFAEIGGVWSLVGKSVKRNDIAEHGAELLKLAAEVYLDLHASLNRTVQATGVAAAPRLWPMIADKTTQTTSQAAVEPSSQPLKHQPPPPAVPTLAHRVYPEMIYAAALTEQQVDDIYRYMSYVSRSIVLGLPGRCCAPTPPPHTTPITILHMTIGVNQGRFR